MKWMLAAALAVFLCAPVQAQEMTCYARATVDQALTARGMNPSFGGVTDTGALLQVYTAADGRYVILVTPPNHADWVCPIASGEGWRAVAPLKKNSF